MASSLCNNEISSIFNEDQLVVEETTDVMREIDKIPRGGWKGNKLGRERALFVFIFNYSKPGN